MNYNGNPNRNDPNSGRHTKSNLERKVTLTVEKILNKCEKLKTKDEKIIYLKKVISDCKHVIKLAEELDGKYLDENLINKIEKDIDENLIWFLGIGGELHQGKYNKLVREERRYYLVSRAGSNVVRDIQNLIEGLRNIEGVLEDDVAVIETTESKEEKATLGTGDRIKVKSGMTDVVRIFEAMKEEGVISSKTTVKDIAELFFSEPADKYLFEKKYNSIKNRLKKDGSSSNSEELIMFVLTLCRKSFYDKEYALEKIIKSLDELQKNITSRI